MRPARAPQQRIEAQFQFARFERLAEIIVGAALQTGDAVFRVAPRGEHEDRDIGFAAHEGGQNEAVFARHHYVEHQPVEGEALHQDAGFRRVGRRGHPESVFAQEALQQAAQPRVVVDHQKMRRIRRISGAASAFRGPRFSHVDTTRPPD